MAIALAYPGMGVEEGILLVKLFLPAVVGLEEEGGGGQHPVINTSCVTVLVM